MHCCGQEGKQWRGQWALGREKEGECQPLPPRVLTLACLGPLMMLVYGTDEGSVEGQRYPAGRVGRRDRCSCGGPVAAECSQCPTANDTDLSVFFKNSACIIELEQEHGVEVRKCSKVQSRKNVLVSLPSRAHRC